MKYTWTYANIGGNTRVIIKSGKDIQHLAELDEKLWTVLACPVAGLEIPEESKPSFLCARRRDPAIAMAESLLLCEFL